MTEGEVKVVIKTSCVDKDWDLSIKTPAAVAGSVYICEVTSDHHASLAALQVICLTEQSD